MKRKRLWARRLSSLLETHACLSGQKRGEKFLAKHGQESFRDAVAKAKTNDLLWFMCAVGFPHDDGPYPDECWCGRRRRREIVPLLLASGEKLLRQEVEW